MANEPPSQGFVTLALDTVFRGRYRILRALKAGGMGAVYEVLDETTNSHRALKVMLPTLVEDADLRGRFALEARVTGDIESDHIVRVFDAGVDEATSTPFIVMDLLRGEDLGALVKRLGPLPPADVMTYLEQAARALDKTHAAGIVHRDLKPENLFLTTRDDGSACVKILDFGIAKVTAQSHQSQGTQALGTPLYMAPEQIRGKGDIGPRADVHALGHIAYTLLAGEAYWDEEKRSSESLFQLFLTMIDGSKEPPVARAQRRRGVELPSGFDAWFARATAARPEDRFDGATAAVGALGPALETPTARVIQVAGEVAAEGMAVGHRSPKAHLWVVAGALLVSITLGIAAFRGARSRETESAPRPPPVEGSPRLAALESAMFQRSIGDFEGAHKLLLGIPDDRKPVDDPEFRRIEAAWARWKIEQVAAAREPAQKKALLKEIVATETVDAKQRTRAAEMLRALDAP
jgi:serine/threonine protein kinase